MEKITVLSVAAMLLSAMTLTSCSLFEEIEPPKQATNMMMAEAIEPATTMPSVTNTTQATTDTAAACTTTTARVMPTKCEAAFLPTKEIVARRIYDYFEDKGYNTAQIAGIIGNADVESNLNPTRSGDGRYFGLFMLYDTPQRQAMFDEMERAGVGKYCEEEYWGPEFSAFDSEADFDDFLEIVLDYTCDPNDMRWQTELKNATSPEEAAEIFLVHYERAICGTEEIKFYEPYAGLRYQATDARRKAASKWYEYFS